MLQFLQNLFGLTKPVEKEQDKYGYLKKLVENLEEIKNNNTLASVVIKEVKPKGFIIKAGGLFGFLSFGHMPWQYKNIEYWTSLAPHLIEQRFFCSIHNIKATNPFELIVDGKSHKFQPIELEEGVAYSSIVLHKSSYGLFLEIGYNFNWQFGSLVGLAHKSNLTDIDTYNNAKNGDIITAYFYGFTNDNKPVFGDSVKGLDFLAGKFDKYIDTVVEVTVKKQLDNKTKYFVEEKYPAILSVTEKIYSDDKEQIKIAVANFKDNEKIFCTVISISKRRRSLQLKLTDEYKRTLIR